MSLVDIHNEWDPLEEVIVGVVDGARVPSPDLGLFALDYSDNVETMDDIPTGPYDDRIIDETREDLDELAALLRSEGVTVRRPDVTDHTKRFGTPDWSADGEYTYCPRDLLLPIGNTIIETPMPNRTRYFETFAYRNLLREYFDSGAHWISAPKPQLLDDTYNVRPGAGRSGLRLGLPAGLDLAGHELHHDPAGPGGGQRPPGQPDPRAGEAGRHRGAGPAAAHPDALGRFPLHDPGHSPDRDVGGLSVRFGSGCADGR
jgi:hypothetical protein